MAIQLTVIGIPPPSMEDFFSANNNLLFHFLDPLMKQITLAQSQK
jgi:hypothetical protein